MPKPENTVAAFREAGRLECQTWSSSTCGARPTAPWPCTTTPMWATWGHRRVAEAPICPPRCRSLDEALDACAGMGVNIEIKNSPADPDYDPGDAVAGAVAGLVLAPARPGPGDRVVVQPGLRRRRPPFFASPARHPHRPLRASPSRLALDQARAGPSPSAPAGVARAAEPSGPGHRPTTRRSRRRACRRIGGPECEGSPRPPAWAHPNTRVEPVERPAPACPG